jgi:RNA 2',3'-cyclic 3'-phosphodiesterase
MRLFLAIAPPLAIREGIHALSSSSRRDHPDLKWVASENYHFTLRFLGETAGAALPVLEEALAGALEGRPAFDLRLGALIGLPPGAGARVLALDLAEGGEPLTELAALIEDTLRSAGFPHEPRSFRAHLTLARSRRDDRLPAGLVEAPTPLQPVWRPRSVELIESRLHPRGPEYRTLREFPLAT